MNSVDKSIYLFSSIIGKRIIKVICCISELDIGSRKDYSFDYCSRVFMVLNNINLDVFSEDIESNDSILVFERSDQELENILCELRSFNVELHEVPNVQNKNINNVYINKKFGFSFYDYEEKKSVFKKDYGLIFDVTIGVDDEKIKLFSGDVYETKEGFNIVRTGEMILVETKETKETRRRITPIPNFES